MSVADVEAWRVYVAGELARFYDHCEGDAYVWQSTPAAERLRGRRGGDGQVALVDVAAGEGELQEWGRRGVAS